MTAEPRLQPPDAIRKICRTLERAGHEAWCVGGAVRDALLGIVTLDWDIATAARPEEVQKLFRRTVPVGLKFGTVGVLDKAGVLHEITMALHADELVVISAGQVVHHGPCTDSRTHSAVEQVFDHRIHVQPVGDQYVALPAEPLRPGAPGPSIAK